MTRESWRPDYSGLAAALLEFAELAPPEPPAAPGKRRGRPKALSNERLGRFLKAVAETHTKNEALSVSRIAAALRKRPEYAPLSERTLRRRVTNTLDWLVGILNMIPADHPDRWEELLGTSPPPQGATTKKALREKAFELLRRQLRRHELLAS
jgi:hypothetical protein